MADVTVTPRQMSEDTEPAAMLDNLDTEEEAIFLDGADTWIWFDPQIESYRKLTKSLKGTWHAAAVPMSRDRTLAYIGDQATTIKPLVRVPDGYLPDDE